MNLAIKFCREYNISDQYISILTDLIICKLNKFTNQDNNNNKKYVECNASPKNVTKINQII